jgi:hypothetical protein
MSDRRFVVLVSLALALGLLVVAALSRVGQPVCRERTAGRRTGPTAGV